MSPVRPPLFYVIGPSGAGKDTLLAGARSRLDGDGVLFAHRYITRPANAGGENHVALSNDEFETRDSAGLFALAWSSHGHRYGVSIEIDSWMALGFAVVVNGSRGYLDAAAGRFPTLVPVLITVPMDLVANRLATRGREDAATIAARLRRNGDVADIAHPALTVVENTGPVEDGVAALLRVLTSAHRGWERTPALDRKAGRAASPRRGR